MGENSATLQRFQIGKEVTKGTPVAAPILLAAVSFKPTINMEMFKHRTEGTKRPDMVLLNKEHTRFTYQGIATYIEIVRILASVVSVPVTLAGPEANTYDHWMRSSHLAEDTVQAYTGQYGSSEYATQCPYLQIPEFNWRSTRDSIEISGSAYGQLSSLAATFTAGANEVQTYTLHADVDGGNLRMGFNGAVAEFAWDANAAAIDSALEALTTIGAGNVSVSRTGTGPIAVTFTGALAGQNVPPLDIDISELLDGAEPGLAGTLVITTPGGLSVDEKIPILPGEVSVYMADTPAGLSESGNKLLRQFGSDYKLADRHSEVWVQDSSKTSYATHVEGEPDETFEFMHKVDTAGMSLVTLARTGDEKFIRLLATGPVIDGTATNMLFRFDACVRVEAVKDYGENQGVHTIGYTLRIVFSQSWGKAYEFLVRNGKSSY